MRPTKQTPDGCLYTVCTEAKEPKSSRSIPNPFMRDPENAALNKLRQRHDRNNANADMKKGSSMLACIFGVLSGFLVPAVFPNGNKNENERCAESYYE